MSDVPMELNWLTRLAQEFHQPWPWLMELRPSVNNFVSFGCMSDEPFFLIWVLDAVGAVIVEQNIDHIEKRNEKLKELRQEIPEAFAGRTITFIQADMTELTEMKLPSNNFDLAFCKRVLYQIFLDGLPSVQDPIWRVDIENLESSDIEKSLQKLQYAINQMARVIKPGGLVVALERISLEPGGEEVDISVLFEKAGLSQEPLMLIPEHENYYSYRKPI